MTSSHIRLSIESGTFDSGFSVSLQCFDHEFQPILIARGQLPAQPELPGRYRIWKEAYLNWGGASRLDPIENEPTNISFLESVREAAVVLEWDMNRWLDSEVFQSLRQKLYQELSPRESTVLILQTQHVDLLRLPWLKWRLFDAFPLTQFFIAPDAYRRIPVQSHKALGYQVRILAVFADDASVDTEGDRLALEALPQTRLTILDQPTRKQMTDHLWNESWDIFYFAGHSSSQRGQGQFIIAQSQWMSTSDLKSALQTAARQGLKLAIFNSCDGLAIAQDLVQNDIPFIITMREPVSDTVAQGFLNYFFSAYRQGQSLFQSFQEAHKRLESIEDQCPCATWLPVLIGNPTVAPPQWQDFLRASFSPEFPPTKLKWRSSLARTKSLFFVGVMLLFCLVRGSGVLQGLELWSFDRMMQLRPQEIQDARLLVVEIDEAMLQSHRSPVGSISDQLLNQAIQILSRHQPRVIGIDIYRDHPTLDPALMETFQDQPTVIGVCKSPDPGQDDQGVPGPRGLPIERLGFSDILEDEDGAVRRQILFMGLSPTKTCVTPWSFSSQLALSYLKSEDIKPAFSQHFRERERALILDGKAFPHIRPFWGAYQQINLGGNQIMLNYRAVPRLCDVAPKVSLNDVLNDRVPDAQIRDRLILIGVTANTTADFWETPYQSTQNHRIPGVLLQAHMTSQIISAVMDHRPLIQVLPRWADLVLMLGAGLIGVILSKLRTWRWPLYLVIGLVSIGLSFWALLLGLWLPLIPVMLSLTMMSVIQLKRD